MKFYKLFFIVLCLLGALLFLLSEVRPKRIYQNGGGEVSVLQNKSETSPPANIAPANVTNETPQFIVTTNEAHGVIVTQNVTDGTYQFENVYPYLGSGNIFYFRKCHGLIKELSTSPEWSAYLASRRGKYDFPIGVREWFLEAEEHNLIDPTTIPREEWERFIDIAIQYRNSLMDEIEYEIEYEIFDKEATVIDFTEDFVYVLWLYPPKTKDDLRRPDFRLWFIIDRKKGEVLNVLMGWA